MKTTMRGLVLMTVLVGGSSVWAQQTILPPPPPVSVTDRPPLTDKQKQLLDEASALLRMAAELKVSVDKSTKDQLSLDVVRKAEAVEKAARELKGKLK